jgi:hypothetical protein
MPWTAWYGHAPPTNDRPAKRADFKGKVIHVRTLIKLHAPNHVKDLQRYKFRYGPMVCKPG